MLSADPQGIERLPSPGCGLRSRSPLRSPMVFASGSPSPPGHKRARSVQRCLPIEYNVFHNDKTIKYMKIIDKCKEQGIGDDIELPRLVLAGERSSGKSSLLESLTHLPVPIMTGQGTRFPIEVTLIEDHTYQIKSKIILDKNFNDLDRGKLDEFNNRQGLTRPMIKNEFVELLREVSTILDVPPPTFAGDPVQKLSTAPKFSGHRLQIEMKGPNFRPLSIMDTPGLYHSHSDPENMELAAEIQSLVERLIKEKQTIIIGVMDANQQCQSIFHMARKVDGLGERTLGVLTKCDRVPREESDELEAVFQVARNKESVLKCGWYAVRNRSSSEAKHELTLKEAKGKESELFSEKPWNPATSGLEKERLGIDALRTGLSKAFCDHIHRQIRDLLTSKKTELQALESNALQDHRKYLRSIVHEYTTRKDQCLKDEGIKQDSQIKEWQKSLVDDLRYRGATREFQVVTTNIDHDSDLAAVRRCTSYLADQKNIYTWINERYQSTNNECLIPGLVPQTLMEELFREQTITWETITKTFTWAVSLASEAAVKEYLQFIHKKKELFEPQKFESLVLKALDAKMDRFRKACLNDLDSRRSLFGYVADEPGFTKEVREARAKRFMVAIARMHDHSKSLSHDTREPRLDKFGGCQISSIHFNLANINTFLTDDRQTVYQIHDILQAHYRRTLTAYIDWIRKEFLNPDSVRKTLDVCSTDLVDALSDEEVKGFFGPDPEVEKAKRVIMDDIWKLETALRELEAI